MEAVVMAALGPRALPAGVTGPRLGGGGPDESGVAGRGPGGRLRRTGRERLALTGVIMLGLLPVALTGLGIAASVIFGGGAAGGCGGG